MGKKIHYQFFFGSESRGELYPATLHLRSPFDPDNLRIQGVYPPADLVAPGHVAQLQARRI